MTAPTRQMPLDEIEVRLGWALRDGRLTAWERGFVLGFRKTCRRGGEPSDKQIKVARRIVHGLAETPLIEAER